MKSAKRHLAAAALLLLAAAAACSTVLAQTGPVPLIHQPFAAGTAASEASLANAYGRLPVSFEANHGQTDRRVKFLSRGSGYDLFFTDDEAVLSLKKGNPERKQPPSPVGPPVPGKRPSSETADFLRMRLLGASPAVRVSGVDELPGKSNYFVGNDPAKWQTNVPTYAKVRYEEVYPGVNLTYYGNQRRLEYDFMVSCGADPKEIRLRFGGAKKLKIDEQGALVLETQRGAVRFEQPRAYQEMEGRKRAIEVKFALRESGTMGFEVGSYDQARPLVIDPVLIYSTYLGGSGHDTGNAIAVDLSGDAYVTGTTNSTDFPTVNALQSMYHVGAEHNAFIAKINPSGSALIYSTYLGGSAGDTGNGIAVDSAGNAYVTGETASTNFPTVNALQPSNSGEDAFVAELNPSGSALIYSTYLGGNGENSGNAIAVDSAGNAYVSGSTIDSTNFPTVNPLQPSNNYGDNTFVAKLNPGGSALIYSTYLGGDGYNFGNGIAADSAGNAYVTGTTNASNFPTVNALQSSHGGAQGTFNAFIAKINANGSALVYSTYLGGNAGDGGGPSGTEGQGIAVDSSGNAYVTGETSSTDFPTVNAIQSSCCGVFEYDAFIAKINASGSALVYSTYLGGGFDGGNGIAVDSSGDAYVTGLTSDTVPTVNAVQSSNGGDENAFVAEINASGSALVYSTYLGGNSDNYGNGVAVDSSGNAYVTGATSAPDFPTVNALQPSNGGGGFSFNAFVAKIFPAISLSPNRPAFAGQPVGTASTPQTIVLTNDGNAALTISNVAISGTNASDFAETDNCVGSVLAGASCSIHVTFTPTATGTRAGTVIVTNNFTGSPLTVPLTGTGITATRIVALSANSLTFTSQMVGATSAAQGLTLGNTGNAPLTLSGLVISGTNSSDFAETDNCGGSVAAEASCTINLTFSPTATGTRTGSLTITDNAPGSPQTVSLSGTGQDFSLASVSSSSATISAGQTANFAVAVSPAGGFNQLVTFACSGAPPSSTCAVSPSSIVLNGSATTTVNVILATSAALAPVGGPPSIAVYRPALLILGLLGLALLAGLARYRRERHPRLAYGLAFLLLLYAGLMMPACGRVSGGNAGTPAATYTLVVSGTFASGSIALTHSTTLTLVVQ